MSFIELFTIFNIVSQPILTEEFPSHISHYYLGNYPDTLLTNQRHFAYINDSLLEMTEHYVKQSGEPDEILKQYWGLNPDNTLAFVVLDPNYPPESGGVRYFYDNSKLVLEYSYASDGELVFRTEYEYENELIVRKISYNSTDSVRYHLEFSRDSQKILGGIEDTRGLVYNHEYVYEGDNVIEKIRTALSLTSSDSREKYYYQNGRLVKSEDYDVEEPVGFTVFEYDGVTPIRLNESNSSEYRPGNSFTVELLGRRKDFLGRTQLNRVRGPLIVPWGNHKSAVKGK